MKKLILGFFILLQTIIFSDENIGYISSFNILRLGANEKNYKEVGKILSSFDIGYISSFNILRLGANEKNYKEVGKILSSFDIVGLEEVFSEAGVQKVVDELEKATDVDWDYHMTSYPVGTKKYKEHYAYVFRTDRVKFLKSRGYFKDRQNDFIREWDYHMTSYPVGTKKYKEHYAYVFRTDRVKFLKSRGYFKDRQNDFIREPYGADFKIGNMDFTFVLLHSI